MRKFWFAYLAKALVIFPGGFGTMDEMWEILTLAQTQKLSKKLAVVLYGTDYWNEVMDLEPMAQWGMISPEDLDYLQPANDPESAFEILRDFLVEEPPRSRDGAGAEDARASPRRGGDRRTTPLARLKAAPCVRFLDPLSPRAGEGPVVPRRSPLPACGERVRVRGEVFTAKDALTSHPACSSGRCRPS